MNVKLQSRNFKLEQKIYWWDKAVDARELGKEQIMKSHMC